MDKYYFGSIDDTQCHPVEHYLHDAKLEGLSEVTLVEAILDNDNPDYTWCMHYGEVAERSGCRKADCPHYYSKSGRGVCSNRGKLYTFGEEVTFKVEQGANNG
jgi:hypothetical protein